MLIKEKDATSVYNRPYLMLMEIYLGLCRVTYSNRETLRAQCLKLSVEARIEAVEDLREFEMTSEVPLYDSIENALEVFTINMIKPLQEPLVIPRGVSLKPPH